MIIKKYLLFFTACHFASVPPFQMLRFKFNWCSNASCIGITLIKSKMKCVIIRGPKYHPICTLFLSPICGCMSRCRCLSIAKSHGRHHEMTLCMRAYIGDGTRVPKACVHCLLNFYFGLRKVFKREKEWAKNETKTIAKYATLCRFQPVSDSMEKQIKQPKKSMPIPILLRRSLTFIPFSLFLFCFDFAFNYASR